MRLRFLRSWGWLSGLCGLGIAMAAPTLRKSDTTSSAHARYVVQYLQWSPGTTDAGNAEEASHPPCRLEVRRESAVAWQLDLCVGEVNDLFFVSDDGERVWVLHTLPKTPRGRDAWLKVVVAELWGRDGARKAQRQVGQLMPAHARDDVRLLGHHFKWLEGALGIRGVPPRVTEADAVEFEVLGSVRQTLSFR